MRLLHASLRQVRLHQHLELRFDPHFTLLGGANEAGKSTVVEALHKVLFLRASATGRAVDELRSRLHSGLPEIAVGFEAAGARWELRKRFSGASGTCQLGSDGGVALQGAAAEEQLARLLGVDGPALRASGGLDDTPGIDLEAAPPETLDAESSQHPNIFQGCALSRLRVRHADALAAAARLRPRLQSQAEDDDDTVHSPRVGTVGDGIGTAQVRGPSGTTAALVAVVDQRVQRLRLRPPDLALIAAVPRALVGVTLDDVAAVVASFGIRCSAVDR